MEPAAGWMCGYDCVVRTVTDAILFNYWGRSKKGSLGIWYWFSGSTDSLTRTYIANPPFSSALNTSQRVRSTLIWSTLSVKSCLAVRWVLKIRWGWESDWAWHQLNTGCYYPNTSFDSATNNLLPKNVRSKSTLLKNGVHIDANCCIFNHRLSFFW